MEDVYGSKRWHDARYNYGDGQNYVRPWRPPWNEKTYAYAVAIATAAHGLSETQLVIDMRTLKEHVKTLREGLLEGPLIYLTTIEEFRAKHPRPLRASVPRRSTSPVQMDQRLQDHGAQTHAVQEH